MAARLVIQPATSPERSPREPQSGSRASSQPQSATAAAAAAAQAAAAAAAGEQQQQPPNAQSLLLAKPSSIAAAPRELYTIEAIQAVRAGDRRTRQQRICAAAQPA
jgi:3-oxoacyl-ACP reductase-like protein